MVCKRVLCVRDFPLLASNTGEDGRLGRRAGETDGMTFEWDQGRLTKKKVFIIMCHGFVCIIFTVVKTSHN